jgi:hypothetical protein
VLHSLQDAKNVPVGAQRAVKGMPLAFEFEVRAKVADDGVRWLGDHVRREGPERRFVYIAIDKSAGDAASPRERRSNVDVNSLATTDSAVTP